MKLEGPESEPFSGDKMSDDEHKKVTPVPQNAYSVPLIISTARLFKLQASLLNDETEESDKKYKSSRISPFSPEARVPMPSEMDDKTTVWKRNERERYRVRCVNDGYERLRDHLPLSDSNRRISKVDTLRLAIRYINHLNAILADENHCLQCDCFSSFQTESELYAQRLKHIDAKTLNN